MRIITKTKANEVSGGNPAAALAAGSMVITGGAAIAQSFDYFIGLGHRIGEGLYNRNHPNQMGQMVYYR